MLCLNSFTVYRLLCSFRYGMKYYLLYCTPIKTTAQVYKWDNFSVLRKCFIWLAVIVFCSVPRHLWATHYFCHLVSSKVSVIWLYDDACLYNAFVEVLNLLSVVNSSKLFFCFKLLLVSLTLDCYKIYLQLPDECSSYLWTTDKKYAMCRPCSGPRRWDVALFFDLVKF